LFDVVQNLPRAGWGKVRAPDFQISGRPFVSPRSSMTAWRHAQRRSTTRQASGAATLRPSVAAGDSPRTSVPSDLGRRDEYDPGHGLAAAIASSAAGTYTFASFDSDCRSVTLIDECAAGLAA
jgi:hypothetical protein